MPSMCHRSRGNSGSRHAIDKQTKMSIEKFVTKEKEKEKEKVHLTNCLIRKTTQTTANGTSNSKLIESEDLVNI